MRINKIEIVRGGNPFGAKLRNGDRLDSVASFYREMGFAFRSENVNTDPTLSWAGHGGILAESDKQPNPLRWICGPRRDTGKMVLWIIQADQKRFDRIQSVKDVTDADLTLVSLIPNPRHNGRKIIQSVLFHGIGAGNDGSGGCITADGFQAIISHFIPGDKGDLILTRADGWDAPDEYRTPEGFRV